MAHSSWHSTVESKAISKAVAGLHSSPAGVSAPCRPLHDLKASRLAHGVAAWCDRASKALLELSLPLPLPPSLTRHTCNEACHLPVQPPAPTSLLQQAPRHDALPS